MRIQKKSIFLILGMLAVASMLLVRKNAVENSLSLSLSLSAEQPEAGQLVTERSVASEAQSADESPLLQSEEEAMFSELCITRQPVDAVVNKIGDVAVVNFEAKGEGLTYQWYVSSKGISYEASAIKTNSYRIKVTESVNGRYLYCVVSDVKGNSMQTDIVKISVCEESEESYLCQNGRKDTHGIVYEGENGIWHIYGKTDGAGYISLSGGVNTIPAWMKSGDMLYVSLNSDSSVVLVFRGFTKDIPDGVTMLSVHDSAVYKVPDLDAFTGIDVRLQVPSDSGDIDVTVTPSVSRKLPYYGQPCLTLIDDDGDIHFLKDVLPLCEELGISISTAVTTMRIGSDSRWMDWEEIQECQSRGAEVLCHTYSHPTPAELKKWSDQDISDRLTIARDSMQSRGLDSGNILVYSSSTGYEERMRKTAESIFRAGIVIGGDMVNHGGSDVYSLKRYRIDYAAGDGDKTKCDWNMTDLKDYIDVVAATGGFEIMMFHTSHLNWRRLIQTDQNGNALVDVDGNPILLQDSAGNPIYDHDGSKYQQTYGHLIYIPMLREMIHYAQGKGVEIVTAAEGICRYYG